MAQTGNTPIFAIMWGLFALVRDGDESGELMDLVFVDPARAMDVGHMAKSPHLMRGMDDMPVHYPVLAVPDGAATLSSIGVLEKSPDEAFVMPGYQGFDLRGVQLRFPSHGTRVPVRH